MESSSAGAHDLHGGVTPTVVIVSTDMVAVASSNHLILRNCEN